jgi:hypothetical protein
MSDKHQSNEWRLPAELAALEKQLAELTPSTPRIDRDRLMFEAGQAAAEASLSLWERARVRVSGTKVSFAPFLGRKERGIFWPAATATMTAATILLAMMLVRQGEPTPVDQMATAIEPAPITEASPAAPSIDHEQDNVWGIATTHNAWPLAGWPMTGYLGQRYIALTQGVDALANDWQQAAIDTGGDLSPPRPPTARDLLREMLPNRS